MDGWKIAFWVIVGVANFSWLAMGGMLQIGAVVLFVVCILVMVCTKYNRKEK